MKVYRTDEVCDVIGEVNPDKDVQYGNEGMKRKNLDGDILVYSPFVLLLFLRAL